MPLFILSTKNPIYSFVVDMAQLRLIEPQDKNSITLYDTSTKEYEKFISFGQATDGDNTTNWVTTHKSQDRKLKHSSNRTVQTL